jgi:hypothetical protein
MVPQIFNWASYKKTDEERRKQRAPTLAEMRCMAWQCIAGGANGLVFYSWFDLWRMGKTLDQGGRALVAEPFRERWADVCTMAGEIAELIPVLLSVDPPADVRLRSGGETVAHRLYGVDGTTVLVSVNTTRGAAEASFAVPPGATLGRLLLGSEPPILGNGELRVRLQPLGVMVCELSTEAP